VNSMFILLYELFVVSKYDEMDCDFAFGVVFYNVFWSADSGYMK
jgi:hypothetical protein